MSPALGILLALLTVEGLLLVLWPGPVRAILRDTPDRVLRIAGAVEIVIAVVIVVLVLLRGT